MTTPVMDPAPPAFPVLKSYADAAAALDHATAQVRAGEVAQVLAVAAMCDLHRVDEDALVAGCERWIQGGADGTPLIGEFVTGEVAGLLGVSMGAAVDFIARVLNVRHRHPTLWRGVCAGVIRFYLAARVADACATARLDAAACARVDGWCATGLAFQPWQVVARQIEGWIIRADPALAAERAADRAATRFVHCESIVAGHVDLSGRVDAIDGVRFDQALDQVADTIEHGDRQARRALAVGVIANHLLGQDALPDLSSGAPRRPMRAELVVHVRPDDLRSPDRGVADVEGYGALVASRLHELLADSVVTCRPILDPDALEPTDAYEVPPTMRFALEQRNPRDVFPWGTRAAHACDADHTTPYDHRAALGTGQTHLGNLGPTARFGHRLRTHGGWRVEQPTPGVFQWTSPLGYTYLVTARGTVTVGRPESSRDPWWCQEPPPEEPQPPPEGWRGPPRLE